MPGDLTPPDVAISASFVPDNSAPGKPARIGVLEDLVSPGSNPILTPHPVRSGIVQFPVVKVAAPEIRASLAPACQAVDQKTSGKLPTLPGSRAFPVLESQHPGGSAQNQHPPCRDPRFSAHTSISDYLLVRIIIPNCCDSLRAPYFRLLARAFLLPTAAGS